MKTSSLIRRGPHSGFIGYRVVQIRAVIEGRPNAVARKLGKRIDDVFQNASNVPSGDYYFSSIQDQEVDRSEFDAATGKHYHNLGGIYDVFIGRTP